MAESIIHILWGAFVIIILRLAFSSDKGVDNVINETDQLASANYVQPSLMSSSTFVYQQDDSANVALLDSLGLKINTSFFSYPYLSSSLRVLPANDFVKRKSGLDNSLYPNQLFQSFSSQKYYN